MASLSYLAGPCDWLRNWNRPIFRENHETDAMVISHFPHGPTTMFTLHNVVLRHDITSHTSSTVSEQYPHLIFEGFSSKLGARVQNILKYLFPVPREESKRVMTFYNENDFISFRHHVFVKNSHKDCQLAEVGPRFQMRREYTSLSFRCGGNFANLCLFLPPRAHIISAPSHLRFIPNSLRNQARNTRTDGSRYRMGIAAVPTDIQEAQSAIGCSCRFHLVCFCVTWYSRATSNQSFLFSALVSAV